ncbi:MAG TPA: hypothetical protein DHV77_02280 [Erysipelotrichaceae bacterium]|nr:hypothetical protein [Erysipelotrichaceae bacterium]
MYNPIFYPTYGLPFIPVDYDIPPTLYALCNSMANYGKIDKTKIKDLAEETHSQIFNFSYPLSDKVSKDDFEKMIINHFLMRRIGFETFTAFQIQLNVKMNEIMPEYNKMFDMLSGWDIFNDGEEVQSVASDVSSNRTETNDSTSSNADRRYSNTPQNQINDVKNGSYVTEYNFDQYSGNANAESESNGTNNRTETIKRTPGDKLRL